MYFSITSDTALLTRAIDDFNPAYHRDYFVVRDAAIAYLSELPSMDSAHRLAPPVLQALWNWGAGERRAPSCHTAQVVAEALRDPTLHDRLTRLANSFEYLALTDGARALLPGAPFETVVAFDSCLIQTLNDLANALLVNNTNVTYPMKALLLITGLMPAYDGQVRKGLAVAGVSGVKKTRYPLPNRDSSDAKKICALPFYIADCASRASAPLAQAIANSRYPALNGHNGRLFDVLFFVQADFTSRAALVTFSTLHAGRRWYAV